MTDVLRAVSGSGGGDSALELHFTDHTTVYVTVDIGFTQDILDSAGIVGDLPYYLEILAHRGGITFANDSGFYATDSGGDVALACFLLSGATGAQGGVLTAGWHTIEVEQVAHGTGGAAIDTTIWLDGTLVSTPVTTNSVTAFDGLTIGAQYGLGVADAYYLRNLKVGTTRGGVEIFSDDLSSGSFVSYFNNFGDLTEVDQDTIDFGAPVVVDSLWYIDFYNPVAEDANPNTKELVATAHPENLHFVKELGSLGTGSMDCEISIHALDDDGAPIVSSAFIGPYRTDFVVRRADLADDVFTGIVTLYGGAEGGEEHVKIAGKGYLHYLERRVWPYDATLSYVNWPDGFRFKVTAGEVGQICKDIAETVRDLSPNFPAAPGATLATRSFSLDYTVDADDTGKSINYEIDAFDSESIYDKIRGLGDASEVDGGFDFVMTVDKVLRIASPGLGDPGSPIWSLDSSNMLSVSQTNTGPEATHVLGVGTGTSTKAGGVNKHFRHNSSIFRRLDDVQDFGGNIKSLDRLETLTSSALSFEANPVHEVSVSVNPNAVNSGGTAVFPDFWAVTNPGKFVDVAYTKLGYANLPNESAEPLKIVSMDCTINLEGDEVVVLGLNQHFTLAADAGLNDW